MVEAVKVADYGGDGGLKACRGCSEDDEDEEEIGRRGSSCCRIEGQDSEIGERMADCVINMDASARIKIGSRRTRLGMHI